MPRFRRVRRANPETGERETINVPFTSEEEAARNIREAATERTSAREDAIRRTREHLVALINAAFPEIETFKDVKSVLGTIVLAVKNTARTPALTLAISQYQYARTKAQELRSAARTEAEAYDPATDPGWPS